MYRYLECGLDDVWLVDGYRRMCTAYGSGVAIADMDTLHKAIAARLTRLPGALCKEQAEDGANFLTILKFLEKIDSVARAKHAKIYK